MERQGKYKYLAKNIGLLTLSNFATKLLSFFLVPLYTSILTTADYGTYDLFNTTVGVGCLHTLAVSIRHLNIGI
jgi:O-antigen/teichoic acid export membrane protein